MSAQKDLLELHHQDYASIHCSYWIGYCSDQYTHTVPWISFYSSLLLRTQGAPFGKWIFTSFNIFWTFGKRDRINEIFKQPGLNDVRVGGSPMLYIEKCHLHLDNQSIVSVKRPWACRWWIRFISHRCKMVSTYKGFTGPKCIPMKLYPSSLRFVLAIFLRDVPDFFRCDRKCDLWQFYSSVPLQSTTDSLVWLFRHCAVQHQVTCWSKASPS